MIERGQIPLTEPEVLHVRRVANVGPSSRSLSVGIIVVGLGLALATIISIAGESPAVGVGVGGAIAILGGAFIVRSLLVRHNLTPANPGSVRPPPFRTSACSPNSHSCPQLTAFTHPTDKTRRRHGYASAIDFQSAGVLI